jgi:predicted DNA-binding ribbon-helix-helix protein
MKSLIVKRSVVIAGHKTSVSLEEAFWNTLKEIAAFRNMPLSNLIASVDREREHANLSSAIRLFILEFCRTESEKRSPRGNRIAKFPDRESSRPQATELMSLSPHGIGGAG